jgi:molecular chaperone GrpE
MKKSKGFDPNAEPAAEQQDKKQSAAAGKVETGETVAADKNGSDDMKSQTDAMAALQEILAAREKDFETLTDKYLRLAAEYDNFRRRSQKEKEGLYADSIALVVKEMLPVIDNLERAGLAVDQYEHEDARKIAEGIAMIQKQAEQALTRLGVCRIACEGQPFNPDLHEGVMHVEDDQYGPSTVVAELQSGYRRDDRVIRHSMVKVAN